MEALEVGELGMDEAIGVAEGDFAALATIVEKAVELNGGFRFTDLLKDPREVGFEVGEHDFGELEVVGFDLQAVAFGDGEDHSDFMEVRLLPREVAAEAGFIFESGGFGGPVAGVPIHAPFRCGGREGEFADEGGNVPEVGNKGSVLRGQRCRHD